MKLSEFLDLWTRKNLAIVLVNSDSFDTMFDTIDDMNDNSNTYMSDLMNIQEYIIGVIEPQYSQFRESYLIKENFAEAEVTNFYVGITFMIIWIKERKNEDR